MPENQRWHTTSPSLKQTNPTVFTRSVFARYFLFSPTLQLDASASGFVGRGEYRMIYPFGRRNSHGKLCLACTIFQFQIDFKVSVCTILRCEHPARVCLLPNWIPTTSVLVAEIAARSWNIRRTIRFISEWKMYSLLTVRNYTLIIIRRRRMSLTSSKNIFQYFLPRLHLWNKGQWSLDNMKLNYHIPVIFLPSFFFFLFFFFSRVSILSLQRYQSVLAIYPSAMDLFL